MQKKEKTDLASGTQLLDRAFAILKELGERGSPGEKASVLAERLGLTVSTTHRIINRLEYHGVIEKDHATKRYRLGSSLFALGAQAIDGNYIRKICRPTLLRLVAETGDTVFLMGRSGFNTICLDFQGGDYVINTLTHHIGGQIPLGVGPSSQTILAFLDPDEVDVILEKNRPQYDNYNHLSVEGIKQRLSKIRKDGYAFDNSRLVEGISALGMPIVPKGREVVGALAINMISTRINAARLKKLTRMLRQYINQIEEDLNP